MWVNLEIFIAILSEMPYESFEPIILYTTRNYMQVTVGYLNYT